MSPADRAAIDLTTTTLAEIEWLVTHGVLTNPATPEQGDVTTKCAAIDRVRPRLEPLPDPKVNELLVEARRLCSLEVPLLNANQAMKQLNVATSQASRRLMCDLATKDLVKARSVKAIDRRVRELDVRIAQACR